MSTCYMTWFNSIYRVSGLRLVNAGQSIFTIGPWYTAEFVNSEFPCMQLNTLISQNTRLRLL